MSISLTGILFFVLIVFLIVLPALALVANFILVPIVALIITLVIPLDNRFASA